MYQYRKIGKGNVLHVCTDKCPICKREPWKRGLEKAVWVISGSALLEGARGALTKRT